MSCHSSDDDADAEILSAQKKAAKAGLASSAFTIALCCDEKTEKCASAEQMKASWKRLRERAKALRKSGGQSFTVLRISCPGVCRSGPIAGVFPDSTWYGECHPKMLDKLIEHRLQVASGNATLEDDPHCKLRLTGLDS